MSSPAVSTANSRHPSPGTGKHRAPKSPRSCAKKTAPGIKPGKRGYGSSDIHDRQRMMRVPFRLILAENRLGTALALVIVAGPPALAQAGECPTSASEIATDRPD